MAAQSSALGRGGEALRLQPLPLVRAPRLLIDVAAEPAVGKGMTPVAGQDRRVLRIFFGRGARSQRRPRPRPTDWGVGGQNLEVRKMMPRDGALTLSDVRQPTLSIVCEPCARRGAYKVARLMELHGDAKLTDLLHTLANCPKARSTSIHDRCKAVFEGLAV